VKELQELY